MDASRGMLTFSPRPEAPLRCVHCEESRETRRYLPAESPCSDKVSSMVEETAAVVVFLVFLLIITMKDRLELATQHQTTLKSETF